MTNRGITMQVSDCSCRKHSCDCPTEAFVIPDEWIAVWATTLAGGRTAPIVREIGRCISWLADNEITQRKVGVRNRMGNWMRRADLSVGDERAEYKKLDAGE